MKSRSLHSSTEKGFMVFFTVTLRPLMKYHSPTCFPSRCITKNAEAHPPPGFHPSTFVYSHFSQRLSFFTVYLIQKLQGVAPWRRQTGTEWEIFQGFCKSKKEKKLINTLSFITRFKIEFLLQFTGCTKVLGKIPLAPYT